MKGYRSFLLALVLAAAFVLGARFLPLMDWMLAVLQHAERMGAWGMLLFALLYIPACLILFPDVLLNMAAGVLWGVALGSALVTVSRGLGASVTFLVVRRFAAGWQRRRIERDPRVAAIEHAVEQQGFKIALMLRLSPVFPIPIVHVALAFTRISFRNFLFATLLGALPRTVVAAYVGSGARSLTALTTTSDAPALPSWVFWSGLVVTLLVTAWLTRFARRTLREAAALSA